MAVSIQEKFEEAKNIPRMKSFLRMFGVAFEKRNCGDIFSLMK